MSLIVRKQLSEHYFLKKVPVDCFQHMSQFFSVYDALQLKATCKFFDFTFLLKAPLLIFSCQAGCAGLKKTLKSHHLAQLKITGFSTTCPEKYAHDPLPFDGNCIALLQDLNLTKLCLRGVHLDLAFRCGKGPRGFEALGKLDTLEELEIARPGIGSNFTDEQLAHLSDLYELRVLKLRSTRISDQGMHHLRHMHYLRVLEIETFHPLNGDCVNVLKMLPRLEELTLIDGSMQRIASKEMEKRMSAIPTLKKFIGEEPILVEPSVEVPAPPPPVVVAAPVSIPTEPVEEEPHPLEMSDLPPISTESVANVPQPIKQPLEEPSPPRVEVPPVQNNASRGVLHYLSDCFNSFFACLARFVRWLCCRNS